MPWVSLSLPHCVITISTYVVHNTSLEERYIDRQSETVQNKRTVYMMPLKPVVVFRSGTRGARLISRDPEGGSNPIQRTSVPSQLRIYDID
ncbi:hypothetical protein AVEN_217715-1 [Araneus ventricosus]|uniref:Uncharacterized protein n=1 Tax=Araneus ventricosus TaxID=182803 RepID=A0A4Y2NLR9_ARAVE|nr:hypothetical protein AVEN_217715-1 [Araneus ventricosus]